MPRLAETAKIGQTRVPERKREQGGMMKRNEGNHRGRRGGEKAWKQHQVEHHRGKRVGLPGKARSSGGRAYKPVENPMLVASCYGRRLRVVRTTAKPVVCTKPLWQTTMAKAKRRQRNRRRSQQRRSSAFANAA